MKLLPKILSGYLIVIAVLLIVGGVMVWSLTSLTDTMDTSVEESKVDVTLNNLEESVLEMRGNLMVYLITGNDTFLQNYNQHAADFDQYLTQASQQIGNDDAGDAGEQASLQRAAAHKAEYVTTIADVTIPMRQQINNNSTSFDDLEAMVNSGAGKAIIDQIRLEVAAMVADLKSNEAVDGAEAQLILTDVISMETGFHGYLIAGNQDFLALYESSKVQVARDIDSLRSTLRRNNEADNIIRLDTIESLIQQWNTEIATPQIAVRTSLDQQSASLESIAAVITDGTGAELMNKIDAELNSVREIEASETTAAFDEGYNTADTAQTASIAAIALGIILGLGLGFYNSRAISQRVGAITEDTLALTGGNLSRRSTVTGQDEVAMLATNFNAMAARLETMVNNEVAARQVLEDTVADYVSFVEIVAQGELDERLNIARDADQSEPLVRLGVNLNQMVNGLEDLTRRIEAAAAQEREAREALQQTVDEYVAFVEMVSLGNLTERINGNRNGNGNGHHQRAHNEQLIKLGDNLNKMVNSLSEMAGQTREVSLKIASATSEILAATTQQLSATTEQDTTINQTSTTTTEVLATVTQTAERAENVAKVAQRSVEVSQQGQQAVRESVEGMNMIRHQVEGIAENILALSEKTQQIGNIIASVNNIAEQSKVLALNASIEAARAGEDGKSFAVVAMEVRNLAEQSREATDQVREILNEIQQATNTAVMATEEGIKGVDVGQGLINRAGDTIQELATVIREAAQAAAQIAASTHQQTVGMDQLSAAMNAIRQSSIQTTASVQQAERSAQDLSSMAKQMQDAVARYNIN